MSMRQFGVLLLVVIISERTCSQTIYSLNMQTVSQGYLQAGNGFFVSDSAGGEPVKVYASYESLNGLSVDGQTCRVVSFGFISKSPGYYQQPAITQAHSFVYMEVTTGSGSLGHAFRFGFDQNGDSAIDWADPAEIGPGFLISGISDRLRVFAADGSFTTVALSSMGIPQSFTALRCRLVVDFGMNVLFYYWKLLDSATPTWTLGLSNLNAQVNWNVNSAQNPGTWNGVLFRSQSDSFSMSHLQIGVFNAGYTIDGKFEYTTQCSTECVAGQFKCSSATTCAACSPGSYSMSSTASLCTWCQPGFGAASVTTPCVPCQEGSYSVGTAPCATCSGGYYCPDQTRKIACVDAGVSCPPGSMFPVACPSGYYCLAGSSAAVRCTVCPAGTYQTSECTLGSNSVCEKCTVGDNYCLGGSSIPTECTVCTTGYYTLTECSSTNNRVCRICPAGQFCKHTNTTPPVGCSAGHFSTEGSTVCSTCSDGTYITTGSPGGCLACPTNSSAPAATKSGNARFYSLPASQFSVSAVHAQQQACVGSSYSLDSMYNGNPCGWTVVWGEGAQPPGSKYMQVNLTRVTFVDAIATAGNPSGWICSVVVNTSSDGLTWTKATANANTDATTVVAIPLMAFAKYIRIFPTCARVNVGWSGLHYVYTYYGALRVGLQLRTSGCTCSLGYAKEIRWTSADGFQECHACDPGTTANGTQSNCSLCGNWTFNPRAGSVCVQCQYPETLQCSVGTYFWPCNYTTDSRCVACPAGGVYCTGSAQVYNCTPKCGSGYHETQACTATTNRICTPCPFEAFCAGGNTSLAVNCTRCGPGWYETAPCTNSTDRRCAACRTGAYYCNGSTVIANCTKTCASGAYCARECTNATDLVCRACTPGCARGMWVVGYYGVQ